MVRAWMAKGSEIPRSERTATRGGDAERLKRCGHAGSLCRIRAERRRRLAPSRPLSAKPTAFGSHRRDLLTRPARLPARARVPGIPRRGAPPAPRGGVRRWADGGTSCSQRDRGAGPRSRRSSNGGRRPTCVAAVGAGGILSSTGDLDHRFALASVTKPLVATATLLKYEEGAIDLDAPCGPPGSTVRHLLKHAGSGDPTTTRSSLRPASVASTPTGASRSSPSTWPRRPASTAEYLVEGVFALGMTSSSLDGSPASGATSTAALRRGRRSCSPPAACCTRARSPRRPPSSSPGSPESCPASGARTPNPWGLGFEIRG